jgi:hypothetical protein
MEPTKQMFSITEILKLVTWQPATSTMIMLPNRLTSLIHQEVITSLTTIQEVFKRKLTSLLIRDTLESSPGSYLEILITLSFWTLWVALPTQLQTILEQLNKQQLPLLKQQLLKQQLQLLRPQTPLLKLQPHKLQQPQPQVPLPQLLAQPPLPQQPQLLQLRIGQDIKLVSSLVIGKFMQEISKFAKFQEIN